MYLGPHAIPPEEALIEDIDNLIKGLILKFPLASKWQKMIDTRTVAEKISRISKRYVEAKLHQ